MSVPKRVHAKIIWKSVRKFQNVELAENEIRCEVMWTRNVELVNNDGLKCYYKCKGVSDTGDSCTAKLCLVLDDKTNEATLYKSGKHNHTNIVLEIAKINKRTKDIIRSLHEQNLQVTDIYKKLKEDHVKVPAYSQVMLYVNALKREVKDVDIDFNFLDNWFQTNSNTPKDDHKAFVITHKIFNDKKNFFAVISTKCFFDIAVDAEVYHLATTQKLAWNNLPTFVLGVTDKIGKFHAVCIILCGSLHYYTFKLIFANIRAKVKEMFSKEISPIVIVADSEVVQDAFADVFLVKTRTCWRYARQQIKNQLKWSTKSPKRIMRDLNLLRSVTCPSIFDAASELFLEKYDHLKSFVAYFKQKWLVDDRKWFLGAARPSPPTNIGLLKYVKEIKTNYGEKLSLNLELPQFLDALMTVIEEISIKYIDDEIAFVKYPEMTAKDWIAGSEWLRDTKKNILLVDGSYTHYEVTNTVLMHDDKKWLGFDDFLKRYFSESRVSIPLNKQQWYLGKCNCPMFYKLYKCKHIFGLTMSGYVLPQSDEDDLNVL